MIKIIFWKEDAQEAALKVESNPERCRRRRQERWDESNICTASCRLRKEEYEALKEECRRQGTTVYGLIRYMLEVYMGARRRKRR